jgi:hypothetical protein
MRALLGIILGAALTMGGAYIYDSTNAMRAATDGITAERPLVNWDVVSAKWDSVTARARAEWSKLAS